MLPDHGGDPLLAHPLFVSRGRIMKTQNKDRGLGAWGVYVRNRGVPAEANRPADSDTPDRAARCERSPERIGFPYVIYRHIYSIYVKTIIGGFCPLADARGSGGTSRQPRASSDRGSADSP